MIIAVVNTNTQTCMKETLRCSNTSQPLITDECIFFLLTVFPYNKENVQPPIWSQAGSPQNLEESVRITQLTCRPLSGFLSMMKWCLDWLLFMIYFTFHCHHHHAVPAALIGKISSRHKQFCALHQACSGLVAERTGKGTRAHTSMQTCR